MQVRCLFFAKSREITGTSQASLSFPQKALLGKEILDIICSNFPNLKALKDSVILSVNQTYIEKDTTVTLSSSDEIAIIPPISGGYELLSSMTSNNTVELTSDVISVEKTTQLVQSPVVGATSVFIGTTRDNFEGKKVVRLEYEAYESQALVEMTKICASIREKWSVNGIAMLHRIGNVPVGEASVVIAISSKHRKESLEAVQFAIDAVKATVTIWKKEVYEDGDSKWKENKECFWTANKENKIKNGE